MNLDRGIKNRFTSDKWQSLLIGSFVKFYNKDLFFNITGSPLDPNKILEYKPLPFEEILLQRRRKKILQELTQPQVMWCTYLHKIFVYTSSHCLQLMMKEKRYVFFDKNVYQDIFSLKS